VTRIIPLSLGEQRIRIYWFGDFACVNQSKVTVHSKSCGKRSCLTSSKFLHASRDTIVSRKLKFLSQQFVIPSMPCGECASRITQDRFGTWMLA
jgi:deoxycytidylate deaminase